MVTSVQSEPAQWSQLSSNIHEGRTKVVEAPWGQPLREVGGKQETGEEGKEEVVTVTGQGVARAAASPAAQKDLHTEHSDAFLHLIYPENNKTNRAVCYVMHTTDTNPDDCSTVNRMLGLVKDKAKQILMCCTN